MTEEEGKPGRLTTRQESAQRACHRDMPSVTGPGGFMEAVTQWIKGTRPVQNRMAMRRPREKGGRCRYASAPLSDGLENYHTDEAALQ